MLAQTSYVTDIEAATTVVLRMLDAQPHLSLDATRKAFLLDTGSFTLADVAPTNEPSTDWTVVSVMLVRRYGVQIASQPVAHETIAAHVTKAAARCSVDAFCAVRTVLQGLLGLGCVVEKTLAGGGKCLTINPACLSGPASAFGGFLHVMPPVMRPIPRIDTPAAADAAPRPSERSLFDAFLEHLTVWVHFGAQHAIQSTSKQYKLSKIEATLAKAGYVDDIPTAAARVLQNVLQDCSLQRRDAYLVAATEGVLLPPQMPKKTVPKGRAIIQHYVHQIAITPRATAKLPGTCTHADGTTQVALDALRALGCMKEWTDANGTRLMGFDPALLQRPLASFPGMSYLFSMEEVPALTNPTAERLEQKAGNNHDIHAASQVLVATTTEHASPTTVAAEASLARATMTSSPKPLTARTSNDTSAASVVALHAATYLGAILEWVEGGDPFFVSYIRSQVRSLLPPDAPMDAAVAAIVASLTQHPQLVFHNSDRPCFLGNGFPPPDDRMDATPPRSTASSA
ncbi:hypothetical protein SPRG_15861, partial [Saprolegnia parasitica CBS 223.65]